MSIPEDLNPVVYLTHVVLGLSTPLFVLGAVFAVKGSTLHRRSGQSFAIAMGVASITALVFMLSRPSNFALGSALWALYGLGTGILTLKARSGFLRVVELALFAIPWTIFLFFGLVGVSLMVAPNNAPLSAIPANLAIAALAITVAVSDFRYARSSFIDRKRRLRRHAIRFGIAAAEVVRAPLITFAPRMFGEFSLDLYFLAPLVLVPTIYFLALPSWLKIGEREPIQSAETT